MPAFHQRSLALACLLAALLLPGAAAALDLHVDAVNGDDLRDGSTWALSLRTIGRAMLVAEGGPEADTIHVAAGTYAENVLVGASAIHLLGGYPAGGGARDPLANPTIVDGGGAGPALSVSGASGSVVLGDVTVDGFTLTGGSSFVRGTFTFGGGGVFIEEAQVVLSNNVIRDNATASGARGGGLYVFRQRAEGSEIRGNLVQANRADDGLGGGVGIVDLGDPAAVSAIVFSQNQVLDNQALALTDRDPASEFEPNGHGGGLWLWGGSPIIEGNVFRGNVAEERAGTDFNGQGGALFLLDSAPLLSGNTIASNRAVASAGTFAGGGGGAYVFSSAADLSGGPTFTGNTWSVNRAEGGTGSNQALGGALSLALFGDAAPLLSNEIIEDNLASGGLAASSRGGGLYAYIGAGSAASLRIEGGRVARNAAPAAGGGLWLLSPATDQCVVEEVEIQDNAAELASGVMAFGEVALRHSRIRGNRLYDPDGDQVSELRDNCPNLANPVQADADADGLGDACDPDDDDDGVADAADNCPLVSNPGQGADCTGDQDGDGVADGADNCPVVANPAQTDSDIPTNGVGDACEPARFDALETNASGIWVVGDSELSNLEITDNIGQGLQIVGFPADPMGMPPRPEEPSSPVITNVTIAGNVAAGFITYLADGTLFQDTIIALNLLSDGFDTERVSDNMPSSPNMTCNSVYFGDGVVSLPCSGVGNLDYGPRFDQPPRFVSGPFSDYYLEQVAAGGGNDSIAVDAGTRSAAASPVAGRTTRIDAVPDGGTVDLGYHPPVSGPPQPDPLGTALRVAAAGTDTSLALRGAPGSLTEVRWFRGDLDLLLAEYSHASPFTGQPGDPECSQAPAASFLDPGAVLDGRNWYYLVVPLSAGVEGSFGDDSFGTARPRPEDSPTDLVTTCP